MRAEREIAAPASVVYRILADYRQHHPQILPPAFSDFVVEQGGVGAGTVISFNVTAGGKTQAYRDVVSEPEPGRVLRESAAPGKVTTFTVEPRGEGGSLVQIESVIPTAGGLRGVLERMFTPRVLGPIIEDELARLDAYAVALDRAGSEPALESVRAASGAAR